MGLTISVREVGEVTILDCVGRLVTGEVFKLHDIVREKLDSGKCLFVLNFKDVTYVDSSGWQNLLSCFVDARYKLGGLKFLNPSQHTRDFMKMSKLDTVFDSFTNEHEAITSLKQSV